MLNAIDFMVFRSLGIRVEEFVDIDCRSDVSNDTYGSQWMKIVISGRNWSKTPSTMWNLFNSVFVGLWTGQ